MVIVPDLKQVCEIMLILEGFLVAKVSTLYRVTRVSEVPLQARGGNCTRSSADL